MDGEQVMAVAVVVVVGFGEKVFGVCGLGDTRGPSMEAVMVGIPAVEGGGGLSLIYCCVLAE